MNKSAFSKLLMWKANGKCAYREPGELRFRQQAACYMVHGGRGEREIEGSTKWFSSSQRREVGVNDRRYDGISQSADVKHPNQGGTADEYSVLDESKGGFLWAMTTAAKKRKMREAQLR
jgi:hypothetical protein